MNNKKMIRLVDVENDKHIEVSLDEYKEKYAEEYTHILFFLRGSDDVAVAYYDKNSVNTWVESYNIDTGELLDNYVTEHDYINVLKVTFDIEKELEIDILGVKGKEIATYIRKDFSAWFKANS
jgi:hypothetical protein